MVYSPLKNNNADTDCDSSSKLDRILENPFSELHRLESQSTYAYDANFLMSSDVYLTERINKVPDMTCLLRLAYDAKAFVLVILRNNIIVEYKVCGFLRFFSKTYILQIHPKLLKIADIDQILFYWKEVKYLAIIDKNENVTHCEKNSFLYPLIKNKPKIVVLSKGKLLHDKSGTEYTDF